MPTLIGNPLSWAARALGGAGAHVAEAVENIGGDERSPPVAAAQINTLSFEDLRYALRKGVEDMNAARGDVVFLCLIYPLFGLALVAFTLHSDLIHMVFPFLAGFALIGPMAAVGLYEISRRREKGLPYSWLDALRIAGAPSFGAIVVLGLYLLAIFGLWMLSAWAIFAWTMSAEAPISAQAFLSDVLTTASGRWMIVIGMLVGFGFALLVLATSVVSFPLLLDRNVGVPNAMVTSVRVALKNPVVIGAWGLIVAAGLALGAAIALVGLMATLPILGHATWHLYRRAVAW